MEHTQTVRILPDAKTAVLFIHGICGTPAHFRSILPLESAVSADWSVYNIVLDGHCATVEDFGRSSMKKWKAQVNAVFDELCCTHEQVILVGHSMGTLLSVKLALKRPEKVPFLFLIAVPLRVAVKPHAVGYLLRIAFDRVDGQDPALVSMRRASGMKTTKRLWKYIPWAPRMVELLRLCHSTGKRIPQLRVPCIVWQSQKDEMVSNRTEKILKESGRVQVHTLAASTHFYYVPDDVEKIAESFRAACKNLTK